MNVDQIALHPRPLLIMVPGILSFGEWSAFSKDPAILRAYDFQTYPHYSEMVQFAFGFGRAEAYQRFNEWMEAATAGKTSISIVAHSYGTMLVWNYLRNLAMRAVPLQPFIDRVHLIQSPLSSMISDIGYVLRDIGVREFLQDYSKYDWTMVLSRMVGGGDAGLFPFHLAARPNLHNLGPRLFPMGHLPSKSHIRDNILPLYVNRPLQVRPSRRLPSLLRRPLDSVCATVGYVTAHGLRLAARYVIITWLALLASISGGFYLRSASIKRELGQVQNKLVLSTSDAADAEARTARQVSTWFAEMIDKETPTLTEALSAKSDVSSSALTRLRFLEKKLAELTNDFPGIGPRLYGLLEIAFVLHLRIDEGRECSVRGHKQLDTSDNDDIGYLTLAIADAIRLAVELKAEQVFHILASVEGRIDGMKDIAWQQRLKYRGELAKSIAIAIDGREERRAELMGVARKLEGLSSNVAGAGNDGALLDRAVRLVEAIRTAEAGDIKTKMAEILEVGKLVNGLDPVLAKSIANWFAAATYRAMGFKQQARDGYDAALESLGKVHSEELPLLFFAIAYDYCGFLASPDIKDYEKAISLGRNLSNAIKARDQGHVMRIELLSRLAVVERENGDIPAAIAHSEETIKILDGVTAADYSQKFRSIVEDARTRAKDLLSKVPK